MGMKEDFSWVFWRSAWLCTVQVVVWWMVVYASISYTTPSHLCRHVIITATRRSHINAPAKLVRRERVSGGVQWRRSHINSRSSSSSSNSGWTETITMRTLSYRWYCCCSINGYWLDYKRNRIYWRLLQPPSLSCCTAISEENNCPESFKVSLDTL